jgi:hypothetical protein
LILSREPSDGILSLNIAQHAAVIDSRLERGHIVLFSTESPTEG